MLNISEDDVISRLKLDNPWWSSADAIPEKGLPKRDYFKKFYTLVSNIEVRRAAILMGPRRVGKTVILYQTIAGLMDEGVSPDTILFVSMDTPVYVGL